LLGIPALIAPLGAASLEGCRALHRHRTSREVTFAPSGRLVADHVGKGKYAFDKPTFLNAFTVESLLRAIGYTPTAFIDLISPRRLLMVLGAQDDLASPQQAAAAFELAGALKRLETFDWGQFGLYDGGPLHDAAIAVQVEWLHQHFPLRA
jgi:hypothetical protein